MKQRRRALRKEATPHEVILWKYLRNKHMGKRFRRQYSIGPYIADFCCPAQRLVIEIDGSHHLDHHQYAYDARRTAYLEQLGYEVLRFTDADINTNVEAVMETIFWKVNESKE